MNQPAQPIEFDVSRDFLDNLSMAHPTKVDKPEIKANAALRFLPSSPDGKLHTAIVGFALVMEGNDRPFAAGEWRFLFSTKTKFNPAENQQNQFFMHLIMTGATKIMALLNPLLMHGNMPVIPFDPRSLVAGAQQAQAAAAGGEAPAAP